MYLKDARNYRIKPSQNEKGKCSLVRRAFLKLFFEVEIFNLEKEGVGAFFHKNADILVKKLRKLF